ncbi:MAG TPA: CAP domain-containing protein [Rhodobacteraceae bacterium]|nr:CAP domain-containing protein [Paracoccaceae bacterium]
MKSILKFAAVLSVGMFMLPTLGAAGSCEIPANASQLAQEAAQAINAQRAAHGRKPLRFEPRLQASALAHACDMAVKGYFSHRGANGSKPKSRLRRQGCRAGLVAENIAVGQTNPSELVKDWMSSPGHRKNILLGRGTNQYGIGIAKAGKAYTHGYLWVLVESRGC